MWKCLDDDSWGNLQTILLTHKEEMTDEMCLIKKENSCFGWKPERSLDRSKHTKREKLKMKSEGKNSKGKKKLQCW